MNRSDKLEDRLIIGFDGCSKDKSCLVVACEENSGYRVINEVFDEEAECIYECLTGAKTISSDENNKILNWIYRNYYQDLDKENLFKRVEEALGFKLFIWQKSFITDGIFRRYGETTARCLKDLLEVEGVPLDFSERPTDKRSDLYRIQLKEIQKKLNAAGVQTRKVFWNKVDKRKYYARESD